MARIAWGIMGDARGHLTRALIMAGELSGHELLFVGGGCVRELAEAGHRVVEVPMPATILSGHTVRPVATAAHFLRIIAGYRQTQRTLMRALTDFGAEHAVSDYEFFLPRAARALGLPCTGFDHQHVLTHCRCALPPGQFVNRALTMGIIRGLLSVPERFLATSFFPAEPRGPGALCLPPVLRPDVPGLVPVDGKHVVVYLRGGMRRDVFRALAVTGRELRVYGMGERPPEGRARFLPFSRQGFLEDMAGAAYVVCNGGHNMTSEALHLGKPVWAFPTALFYEQAVNAWNLRRLDWGDMTLPGQDTDVAARAFEASLEQRRARLKGKSFFGNREAAAALEERIAGRWPGASASGS